MAEDRPPCAVVVAVEPGPAERAGLRPGDTVLAVDGARPRDVIDWLWLTEEPAFDLRVARGAGTIEMRVVRPPGELLGVSFGAPVFDGVRECENGCTFCFVSQLPPGLRASLSVRDDDYRLSFLGGNFITLTNLAEDDISRIIAQRLSPLHVSVHAVTPEVRARMIRPTVEDTALEVLDRLLEAGVEIHAQVVLVPGVNDGAELEATVAYLAERPGVVSIGCVPAGVTRAAPGSIRPHTATDAERLLGLLATLQDRYRRERGCGLVYAADEFYLQSMTPLPEAAAYDGFPQYENGIGMARAFIDEFHESRLRPRDVRCTLVTGEMFAPVALSLLRETGLEGVRTLAVSNRLFGGNVSVTGLLGGADIIAAIAEAGDGPFLVPDVVVNSDGLLLDDIPADELGVRASADVRIIGSGAGALIEALTRCEGR